VTTDLYSAVGVLALIKAKETGLIEKGPHVVIISTGRPDIIVKRVDRSEVDIGDFIDTLDNWLGRFSDPKDEILDALDNAFEEGFVLGAYQGTTLSGIAVLSRMHFKRFFPSYHLSYIASDPRITGRGVGTSLLDMAIELTGGEFSLHVEPDNKKAINVYRKMGMDVKYLRMHFKSKGESP
jgi:threonine synthase